LASLVMPELTGSCTAAAGRLGLPLKRKGDEREADSESPRKRQASEAEENKVEAALYSYALANPLPDEEELRSQIKAEAGLRDCYFVLGTGILHLKGTEASIRKAYKLIEKKLPPHKSRDFMNQV